MKNKKLLAAAMALMLLPMTVIAQTAYKGQLRLSGVRITEQGDLLRLQFRASYGKNVLNQGETLNVKPVIKNDTRSQSLSSVVITAKDSTTSLRRLNIPVAKIDDRSAEYAFTYDTTIPMAEWMRSASLYIESEESDGKSKQTYEDKVLDSLNILKQPTYAKASKTSVVTTDASALPSLLPQGNATKSANAEWIQFLAPSSSKVEQFTVGGTIPLADSRGIGGMHTRKFNENVYNAILRDIALKIDTVAMGVSRLSLVGYGAPTGNYQRNEMRSNARALELKNYLMSEPRVSANSVAVTWVAEDWDSIVSIVENSDIRLRTAALDIMRNVEVGQGREQQLQMLASGATYAEMQRKVFPKVCRMEYTATLIRSSATADVPADLAKLYATAQRYAVGTREHNDILDLAARLFPDNAEARIDAAGVALLRGDIAQAANYLRGLDTDSRAWNNLGVLYMLQGNASKAEVYLSMSAAAGTPSAVKALEYLRNNK